MEWRFTSRGEILSDVLSIWGGRYLEREEIESLLRDAKIARFCCHNDDGTIHATPVWYKYENEEILISTPDRSRKAKNVKRNKNVTILIDTESEPVRGVMVYGEAELDYNDVLPMITSICEKYLPKDKAKSFSEEMFRNGVNLLIKVKPKNIASFYF